MHAQLCTTACTAFHIFASRNDCALTIFLLITTKPAGQDYYEKRASICFVQQKLRHCWGNSICRRTVREEWAILRLYATSVEGVLLVPKFCITKCRDGPLQISRSHYKVPRRTPTNVPITRKALQISRRSSTCIVKIALQTSNATRTCSNGQFKFWEQQQYFIQVQMQYAYAVHSFLFTWEEGAQSKIRNAARPINSAKRVRYTASRRNHLAPSRQPSGIVGYTIFIFGGSKGRCSDGRAGTTAARQWSDNSEDERRHLWLCSS